MTKNIIYIVVGIALIVFAAIRLINNKETTQDRIYQYDKETPISVQVDSLKLEFSNAEYSYTGSFEPNKESKISAEIQNI